MAQKTARKRPPQAAPPAPPAPVNKALQLRGAPADPTRLYPFSATAGDRVRWGPFFAHSRIRVLHRAPERSRLDDAERSAPRATEEEAGDETPLKVGDRRARESRDLGRITPNSPTAAPLLPLRHPPD